MTMGSRYSSFALLRENSTCGTMGVRRKLLGRREAPLAKSDLLWNGYEMERPLIR